MVSGGIRTYFRYLLRTVTTAEINLIPAGIYLFTVNTRNPSERSEICSKLIE